jgi:hypothetical protein
MMSAYHELRSSICDAIRQAHDEQQIIDDWKKARAQARRVARATSGFAQAIKTASPQASDAILSVWQSTMQSGGAPVSPLQRIEEFARAAHAMCETDRLPISSAERSRVRRRYMVFRLLDSFDRAGITLTSEELEAVINKLTTYFPNGFDPARLTARELRAAKAEWTKNRF